MDLAFLESLQPATTGAMSAWQAGDAWLAGGTALFSEPAPDLRRLFDLRAFGWPPLTVSRDGLEIAATCTIEALYGFVAPSHWTAATLFTSCPEALYASRKVWLEATVGGNLCVALPAGAMIAMAAALDATCTIWMADGGERRLAVTELVTGAATTSLRPGELLRCITIGAAALTSEVAVRRASLSPRGRSAALVIGRRALDGATQITVTASVLRPLVLRFPGPPSASELASALARAAPEPYDDVHGDPDWRAHLTTLLSEQVRAELEPAG